MNHMTAEQRADDVCNKIMSDGIPLGKSDYLIILDGIKQAMRDQRHACTEALLSYDDVAAEVRTAVFNAAVKG